MPRRDRHAARRSGVAPAGPRRSALEQRRRRQRRRAALLGGGVAAAVLITAVVVASMPRDRTERGGGLQALASPEGDDTVSTTLVFGTREADDPAEAVWITLLSLDADSGTGAVVYIPAHTAAEIPGRGFHPLGDALATGGVPLLLLASEQLLGVQIDRYLELSDRDARVFLKNIGPVTVDVPHDVRVAAGRDRVRIVLTEGKQTLPAGFLVRLLYTVGIDGDDAELGTRHLAFWDAVLRKFASEPGALAQAVLSSEAAAGESDAPVQRHARFLSTLVELGPERRTLQNLPVTQVSVGGDELYEADAGEIRSFMRSTVGRSVRGTELRVQVLNGNGVPGIGQEVAESLNGRGFRVILSGNARRLDYRQTLVIAYESSAEAMAAARRARELIGVGRVQISAQRQGIVDLTIVVGKDYLRSDQG